MSERELGFDRHGPGRPVATTPSMSGLASAILARVAVSHLRTLATDASSTLPTQALFVLGELARRDANEGLAFRSHFDDTYTQLSGQCWHSLREPVRARRRSARYSQARRTEPLIGALGNGTEPTTLQATHT
jgi:hypothetical protein